MSKFSLDNLRVEAELHGDLTNYSPVPMLSPPDGVLSFTYRLVVKLIADWQLKCSHGVITSSYLQDLQNNIRVLLQQAEERSQIEDLTLIKEPAEKLLCVLEHPTTSVEDLARMLLYHKSLYPELLIEEAANDDIDGQNLNPDAIRNHNTRQPWLKSDLIEGPPILRNTNIEICKTSEIDESASSLIRSLEPTRKPCKSDYETLRLISSGAFGAVYLVRHKDSDHIFAMKKLDRQDLDRRSLRSALLERDILAFTECPFVVSMLSSFPTRDHLCMVMEYVGGGDCGTLLRISGRLSITLARIYIAETVLAVEYLHSYGVVHRDLKPDNLLISSTGHIKVTDFGLSKLGFMSPTNNIYKAPIKDITGEFYDCEMCGTPTYLAPEVIMEKEYGRPVDWWAVGIILHEFLVGFEPFVGETKSDLFIKIVRDDVTWDSDYTVPSPDAQDMITELLRKDPRYRLGTGGANEIKSHPFLCDLDFNNILSQKPEFVPQLESDIDTSYFSTRSDIYNHMGSENEEDTSEDKGCLVFQNFTSSSHQLSKLYTTNTRMMNNEECSPEYSLEMQKESYSRTDIGELPPRRINTVAPPFRSDAGTPLHFREDAEEPLPSTPNISLPSSLSSSSSSSKADAHSINISMLSTSTSSSSSSSSRSDEHNHNVSLLFSSSSSRAAAEDPLPSRDDGGEASHSRANGDNQWHNTNISLSSSSALSEYPVQKKTKKAVLKRRIQESENIERESRTRGSIFCRLLSSCRRGLSRAVRSIGESCIFACCYPTRDI